MPAQKCPICGADLPEAGMEGLCPRCVVRQVLAADLDSAASDSPANDGTSGEPAPEAPGQAPTEHGVAPTVKVPESASPADATVVSADESADTQPSNADSQGPNAPLMLAESPVVHGVADWIPGQKLLDDFVVTLTLGEGGMGKVYLVRSRSTESRFAVKRAKGLKASDRRKFLAELQT